MKVNYYKPIDCCGWSVNLFPDDSLLELIVLENITQQ